MEEIAENVYIEGGYPGVILTAFNFDHGLIMVDSPFRAEDIRSWRGSLLNLGGGVDKLLVMLDTHVDRTLGIKAMESQVLGHEKSVQILKSRPTSARSQDSDTGADWVLFDLPTNIRWVVPHMTYDKTLTIYWGEEPLTITYHPGAHFAGSWIRYDKEKLLFVGDSVVVNQPPFFAWANIDVWLAELESLSSDQYVGYRIISGRNGLIRSPAIEKMVTFLRAVKSDLDDIAANDGTIEDVMALMPKLMGALNINTMYEDIYQNRLSWGLTQYYERHYLMTAESEEEKS